MTRTFAPAADAYVSESAPTQAYGSAAQLEVDSGPAKHAYLRFSVQGLSGAVTKAVLRLYVLNGSSGGPYLYATAPWTQTPTWATRPAVQGASVVHLAGASTGVWAELDVTSLVKGDGEVHFGLLPSSSDGLDVASAEHADATRRPQLVVTTSDSEPPPPPSGTGTVTVTPAADTYVSEAAPTSTYATSTTLQADLGPALEAYLRFDYAHVTAPVRAAKLRLYVTNGTSNGPRVLTSGAWSTPPTWSTRPWVDLQLADFGALVSGSWVEVDVTHAVSSVKAAYFAVLPQSTDGADFASAEYADASKRPQLVLTVDGGTPPPPPPPAGTQELRLAPTADATARAGSPGSNFGSASTLYVDQSPDDETFLRFRVAGVNGKVTRALLRVYALNGSTSGPRLFRTATTWAEAGLTWSSRPARTSAELGRDSGGSGTWFEYDVTSQLPSEGDVSFVLAPTSGDGADFASREATDATRRPQLVLTVETPTTTGGRVEAAHAYDRGSLYNGPLAHHAGTGDVLLAWGGTSELRFERRTALNAGVWSHTWRVNPLPPPPPDSNTDTESPSGQVLAAAFAPDGTAWLVLKYIWGTMDFGAGQEPPGVYLVQLSPEGELGLVRPFWQQGRGPGATPWAIDVDGTGHVVLTGSFQSGTDFGAGPVAGVATEWTASGFVARYTPQGALHWVRVFGNTGWSEGLDVATGPSGEVLVGGRTQGQERSTFDGTPIMGDYDAFGGEGMLARLSADGTLQWVKGLGERIDHVALSHLGTAVAVVHTVDPLRWGTSETAASTTALVTFEVNGAPRWLQAAAARTPVWGLDVDGAGSARVLIEHSDFAGGAQPDSEHTLALTRVNLDGSHVWTTWLPGMMEDAYESGMRPHLAVAPGGQSWVFGSVWGTRTFGDFTLPATGRQSVLLRLAP